MRVRRLECRFEDERKGHAERSRLTDDQGLHRLVARGQLGADQRERGSGEGASEQGPLVDQLLPIRSSP